MSCRTCPSCNMEVEEIDDNTGELKCKCGLINCMEWRYAEEHLLEAWYEEAMKLRKEKFLNKLRSNVIEVGDYVKAEDSDKVGIVHSIMNRNEEYPVSANVEGYDTTQRLKDLILVKKADKNGRD